jgi:sn-glycerol 3-phosphate transport system ATP-binding protein
MASISLRNVVKKYGKGKQELQVIHGVNAEIADREFIVIVGPSGCGKSTLLRMVAGLEEISGGEISIGDRVVNDLEPAERDIAMVFQNYALYPHMSVFDNMAYGLKIRKMPIAEIKQRVDKAAGILELGHLLDRKPRQLSGGQRQRVAMGRAIVRQPQVFLFDEPLSNLDAKLRAQTRLEIQKLHRELGITSLFVTHDQVEAMTLAQRMIVMNAGRMEQFGTPEEVYHRPASTFVASFIGSPPMNLLKNAPGGRPAPSPASAPSTWTSATAAGKCASRRSNCWAPSAWSTAARRRADHRPHRGEASPRRRRPGDPREAARRTACTGSTPRPASAGLTHAERLALSALGRAPRRRQAGAREHAGRLPPRRRARLPHVRVRREAVGRRRALPDARRHAGAHHQRRGLGGDQPWDELAQLDAGSWHSRGTPASRCPPREPGALLPRQRPLPEHRDQADAGHRSARPASGGRAKRRGSGHGAGGAAAADVVPAESLQARGARAPQLPRGLLLDTCGTAGWTAPRCNAWPSSATTRCGTPRTVAQVQGCLSRDALPELHGERPVGRRSA